MSTTNNDTITVIDAVIVYFFLLGVISGVWFDLSIWVRNHGTTVRAQGTSMLVYERSRSTRPGWEEARLFTFYGYTYCWCVRAYVSHIHKQHLIIFCSIRSVPATYGHSRLLRLQTTTLSHSQENTKRYNVATNRLVVGVSNKLLNCSGRAVSAKG